MELERVGGIYKITSPKGRVYIGQSVDIYRRWMYYKRYACVGQPKLYRSLMKHGWENHKFEIIDYRIDNLDDLEMYYIGLFESMGPNGLNLKSGGFYSKYSDETKLKMRNAKLGKKRAPHSEETKRKIKETCLKRDWSYMTDELKKRMSDDQKGRAIPEEWIAKAKETKRRNKLKNLIIMRNEKLNAVPMFNYLFLTCNKKSNISKSGIITNAKDVIDMKQDILKTGDSVRTLKAGYTVEIDPRPYFVKDWKDQNNPSLNEEIHKKHVVSIAWPIEEIDGQEVMVVPDNHIRMFWRNGLE